MDDLLNKKVPYSLEAEQAVLGAMLIDPSCIDHVIGKKVQANDFYSEINRKIFNTIETMFSLSSQSIDPVVLTEQLKRDGIYDEVGGREYLVKLMEVTPP